MQESGETKGSEKNLLEQARLVIRIEAEAVSGLMERIDQSLLDAVDLIYDCHGRVIVSGVGKSGIVGRKLAATLTSTGTPAIFIHPVDSMHGDLGLVTRDDVFIAVSKSGETGEMECLLHLFKRLDVRVIAITGAVKSSLARMADVVLDVGVAKEACPYDLAPTASATAAMVMGDALAVALLVRRNFRPEDFARLHPAGTLGRRLLLKVSEIMLKDNDIGLIDEKAVMKDALLMLVGKRGICSVVDREGKLLGVVTDGDFKRLLHRTHEFMDIKVNEVMNRSPKFAHPDELCVEAAEKMEKYAIVSMPVLDERRRVVGVVHLHDLMRARVI
ncbi:MAG: KpsF/GutQ family sugar-phosphate isomerase [Gemmatimonadota bacterium]|nr:KpsF/GutQ family sugar-phosphate isomerase [Gemmatimonadota bacterium]